MLLLGDHYTSASTSIMLYAPVYCYKDQYTHVVPVHLCCYSTWYATPTDTSVYFSTRKMPNRDTEAATGAPNACFVVMGDRSCKPDDRDIGCSALHDSREAKTLAWKSVPKPQNSNWRRPGTVFGGVSWNDWTKPLLVSDSPCSFRQEEDAHSTMWYPDGFNKPRQMSTNTHAYDCRYEPANISGVNQQRSHKPAC